MTELDKLLTDIDARANAATPGPWRAGRRDTMSYTAQGVRFKNVYTPAVEDEIQCQTEKPMEDSDFIAVWRTQ